MAMRIQYVAKASGAAFNAVLAPRFKNTAKWLADLDPPDSFIDCKLPGSDLGFLAVLTGELTWISLPLNYALLDSDKYKAEIVPRVQAWENLLKSLLPGVPIVRVHEGALEDWQHTQSDEWYRDASKFDDLCTWLRREDPLDWQRIQ